jgi:hypothetical protein
VKRKVENALIVTAKETGKTGGEKTIMALSSVSYVAIVEHGSAKNLI